MSWLRRRRRNQHSEPPGPSSDSRFDASDKEPVTVDVEKGMGGKPSGSRAYPKIMDPAKIGVAVGSPGSQHDRTPASTHSANSMAKLLPSPPPQNLRVGPSRFGDYHSETTRSAGGSRPSPDSTISPPSTSKEMLCPVSPFPAELHGESAVKPVAVHVPAPTPSNIQVPKKTAQLPRANKIKHNHVRESTQSVTTIINDEPMSPAPVSKFSTLLKPPQSLAPPAQPREDAESRDYIPSYYMQPTLPTILPSPDEPLPTPDSSKLTQILAQNGSSPKPTGIIKSPDGGSSTRHTTTQSVHTSPLPVRTPPSRGGAPSSSKSVPVTPPARVFGLPANPRTPPKDSPPPRASPSPNRARPTSPPTSSNLSHTTTLLENTASPPSSKQIASRTSNRGTKSPPSSLDPRSRSRTNQRPTPPPARRHNSRKGIRNSIASETSFETSGDEQDVITPEYQVKRKQQLSPLQENKGDRSPIKDLRYPKVPRPANQAITRRDGSPTRPGRSEQSSQHLRKKSSASSLLEKRKGSDAANDLQKALWITGSNGRTGSTTTHGQKFPVRSSSRKGSQASPGTSPGSQDMQIKTPLWEPKLTPKRMSDGGLVIEVT